MAEKTEYSRVNTIAYFSGADRAILKELPKQDRRPYLWLGIYNFIVAFLLTVDLLIIFKRYGNDGGSENSFINAFKIILFPVFFLIQIIITRKLINAWSLSSRFFYISWGIIICILPLFLYSNNIEYYSEISVWYKFFLPLIIYTLPLAFFYILPYIIINQNRNDFYNQLKEKKRSLTRDILEKQRQQILNSFVSNSEIELTAKSINANKDLDPETKKIFMNISSAKDSKSLEAYADYQFKINDYDKALLYYNQAIEFDPNNPDLWRKKIDILKITNNVGEEQQAKARYNELFKTDQFNNNLSHQIALNNIELNNISFYGSFTWNLKKNVNILLGKNGYGKSHLMGIVLSILQEEEKIARDFTLIDNSVVAVQPYIKIKLNSDYPVRKDEIEDINMQLKDKMDERDDFILTWRKEAQIDKPLTSKNSPLSSKDEEQPPHSKSDDEISSLLSKLDLIEGVSNFSRLGIKNSYGKIPILAIPDSRFINKSISFTLPVIDEKAKKLLENGAYHFISEVPYETAIQNFLNTISIIYTNESNPAKKFSDPIFKLIDRVFKNLTGQEFKWIEIKRTEDNSGFIIIVRSEGGSVDLPIQKVSQGTLSVIAMIGLIYQYLSLRYQDTDRDKIAAKHAVVFIDEIDAHLHPSWQQKIIGLLRAEFPNIQFVISAHSPLIAGGCLEDEVSVLRQTPQGFKIQQFHANFIGNTVAELYKKIFEIEDRDENYLKYTTVTDEALSELYKRKETLLKKELENNFSAEEANELNEIFKELNYIDSAKQVIEKRSTAGFMESENIMLKDEVQRLENELQKSKSVN